MSHRRKNLTIAGEISAHRFQAAVAILLPTRRTNHFALGHAARRRSIHGPRDCAQGEATQLARDLETEFSCLDQRR